MTARLFPFLLLLVLAFCSCREEKRPFRYFRNYQRTFNDLNRSHLRAARQCGISPIRTEEDMKKGMGQLEKISTNRHYVVDRLTHSIPYLVPRAEELLHDIGRNFRDSLDSKGLDDARIIVTSVLRTSKDLARLRRRNANASANSAHMYGTTFDIAYARFDGAGPKDRDRCKSVLAEVLRDLRNGKRCYVLYEVRQGCFHITVR